MRNTQRAAFLITLLACYIAMQLVVEAAILDQRALYSIVGLCPTARKCFVPNVRLLIGLPAKASCATSWRCAAAVLHRAQVIVYQCMGLVWRGRHTLNARTLQLRWRAVVFFDCLTAVAGTYVQLLCNIRFLVLPTLRRFIDLLSLDLLFDVVLRLSSVWVHSICGEG